MNGKFSTDKNMHFSVPQGSIVGPVLFNSYSLTIHEVNDTKLQSMPLLMITVFKRTFNLEERMKAKQ